MCAFGVHLQELLIKVLRSTHIKLNSKYSKFSFYRTSARQIFSPWHPDSVTVTCTLIKQSDIWLQACPHALMNNSLQWNDEQLTLLLDQINGNRNPDPLIDTLSLFVPTQTLSNNLPRSAWKRRLLKMRMTLSMAVFRGLSWGLVSRVW